MKNESDKRKIERVLDIYATGKDPASFKNDGAVEADMAKLEQMLGRDFYAKPAAEVAQGLLGREMVRRIGDKAIRGKIVEVSAWEGHTDSSSDGMLDTPGTVSISTKFGKHLLDIATNVGGVYSCVMMIAADMIDGDKITRVEGPGNFTKAFQIDKSLKGIKIYESPLLYVIGGRIPEQNITKREKSNVPANCMGYFCLR